MVRDSGDRESLSLQDAVSVQPGTVQPGTGQPGTGHDRQDRGRRARAPAPIGVASPVKHKGHTAHNTRRARQSHKCWLATPLISATGGYHKHQADVRRANGASEVATQVPSLGGRYWDRTSDLLGVNEALSR